MKIVLLIFFFILLSGAVWVVLASVKKQKVKGAPVIAGDVVLNSHINFYRRLNTEEKQRFIKEVNQFLEAVTVTAVNTTVTDTDKILIAAGAVIPMFAFKGWTYPNLKEVLVYNDTFNMDFQTESSESRNILGLVGTGVYKDKMMISRNALQYGFSNDADLSNTAIHEFVHLIDGADGAVDGVPEILLEKQFIEPWVNLVREEMEKMLQEDSDINPYGYTNPTEFFAVISEYFFENPDQFAEKHPELFEMMERIFRTKKSDRVSDRSI